MRNKIGRLMAITAVVTAAVAVTPSQANAATQGPYLVVGLGSVKCVDVPGPTNSNVGLDIYTCNRTSTNLQWYQDSTTSGYSQWRNRYSGKCMTVLNASTANGARVIQYQCAGNGANSEWVPVYLFSGGGIDYYALKNRHSGKCLTVLNASGVNNAPLIQYDCRGDQQNWVWTWVYPSQW